MNELIVDAIRARAWPMTARSLRPTCGTSTLFREEHATGWIDAARRRRGRPGDRLSPGPERRRHDADLRRRERRQYCGGRHLSPGVRHLERPPAQRGRQRERQPAGRCVLAQRIPGRRPEIRQTPRSVGPLTANGTTRTGLDQIVCDDCRGSGAWPETSRPAKSWQGARSADAMNKILVEAMQGTGVANDGSISVIDVRDLNAYIRVNHTADWTDAARRR